MRCDEALHIKADPIFQLIEFYRVLHNKFGGTKVSYQSWGLRRWVVLSLMWFPLYRCHSLFRLICFNQCKFYLYHRYKIVHVATTEAFWHEDGPAKCLLSNNFKIVREVFVMQISLLIDVNDCSMKFRILADLFETRIEPVFSNLFIIGSLVVVYHQPIKIPNYQLSDVNTTGVRHIHQENV